MLFMVCYLGVNTLVGFAILDGGGMMHQ